MNPPSRVGGDRLNRPTPRLDRIPAAADDEGRHAAFLRGQLQAPALGEVEHSHFADDGHQAAAAQGFLDRPERVLVAPCVQMEEACGIAGTGRERTGVEIALPCNPEGMAGSASLRTAEQARCHYGSKTRFFQIGACAGDFMEGPQTEAATRQMPVDALDAPREGRRGCFLGLRGSRTLQQRDPALEGAEARSGIGRWMGGGFIFHILFLFSLMGESRDENV